jgi:cephalosporin-C deacetylase-like acetyl esterase
MATRKILCLAFLAMLGSSFGADRYLWLEAEDIAPLNGWLKSTLWAPSGGYYIYGNRATNQPDEYKVSLPEKRLYRVFARVFEAEKREVRITINDTLPKTVGGVQKNSWTWFYLGTITDQEAKLKLEAVDPAYDAMIDTLLFTSDPFYNPPQDYPKSGRFGDISDYTQIAVTTDHADAIYKLGETVTFTIKLSGAAPDATVSWEISKDGVPPTTSGKIKLSNGTAEVTGRLDEPGFLLCRADFVSPENKALTAYAGAAVAPLQIKPSMAPPDDFDAFWTGEKKKLALMPMNPRLTPQDWPDKAVEVFDLQADAIGNPVSGYFARPVAAKPKSLPIILTLHGAGVISAQIQGAAYWAAQGFLSMDMNAHGIPNGKPAQFYTDLLNGELKDYPWRGRESRDTIYFHDMFLRLVRALDFLTAQPEWDGRTVVVFGNSQGGFQSIAAAGLDPRVTFFAAGVPAGCDHTGFKAGRINGWPKLISTGETPPASIIDAVRYYDAVNLATRTKAAGIVTVGFIDTTCPPSSVYAAFNAIGGKREMFNSISTDHFFSVFSAPANEAMRKAVRAHVDEMKR